MNHKLICSGVAAAGLMLFIATGAIAVDSEVGHLILKQECNQCHAVGVDDKSPLPIAPPFRDIAKRYPPANLTESLAEGIVTGHDGMPEFTFKPEEITAIVSYLETLRAQ